MEHTPHGKEPSTGCGRTRVRTGGGRGRRSPGAPADTGERHDALPAARNALLNRGGADAARRRVSVMRDALHAAAAPHFGRRGVVEEVTPEDRYRRMLGLPLHRRLAPAEIHQAFKRAAKTVHPDGGGDSEAFLALAEARDALMHPNGKGD